jgi:hypothetical protein
MSLGLASSMEKVTGLFFSNSLPPPRYINNMQQEVIKVICLFPLQLRAIT